MVGESKVLCPWCLKGEVYVEGNASVVISVRCPHCSRCFKARLDTMRSVRILPRRKADTPTN